MRNSSIHDMHRRMPRAGRPVRVCVTGGIACGKNLVGDALVELGVPVIDADQVCHDQMKSGHPLFRRIVAVFGKVILGSDGEISRSALARRVFSNAGSLKKLNRLMHPKVIRVIEAWMRKQVAGGHRLVAALVPLVYEAGWERAWDWIICVGAPVPLQMKRLKQRGLTASEARARIAAQWPVEEKMRRADSVVFNDGTRDCARRQTARIFKDITQHRESQHGRKP